MSESVLVALISLAGIVLSGVISAVVSSSLVKYRLEQLEKKVDEHNGYAKKFAETSKLIAVLQTDVSYLAREIREKMK